jgi:indolepyruvate ferredoxin oxidoreductase
VINTSLLPSGEMIRDVNFSITPLLLIEAIRAVTRTDVDVRLAARAIAEGAFGDHMMTNLVTLGAAYQAGLIPVSAASIEDAIRLNGVAVENNLLAFAYGRLAVYDSAALLAQVGAQQPLADRLDGVPETDASRALLLRCDSLDEEARRLLRVRINDLIAYQNAQYASRYVDTILRVAERERTVCGKDGALTRAAIRSLHKLMAYKDEYEVARLYVDGTFSARSRALFASPRKMWYNLQPPILSALGLKRKIRLGSWFTHVFRMLASAKGLRGTAFDVFGYAQVRRVERELIGWYEQIAGDVVARLSPQNAGVAQELLEIPDSIRGYEDVKLANVTRAHAKAGELLAKLR